MVLQIPVCLWFVFLFLVNLALLRRMYQCTFQQARLRSLAPGVDPLLALGSLSLAGAPGDGSALLGTAGQRTSPQEVLNSARVPELKIHR